MNIMLYFLKRTKAFVLALLLSILLIPSLGWSQPGTWVPSDTAWVGSGTDPWRLRARVATIGDSGRFTTTRYAAGRFGGFLEYLPQGYNTSDPNRKYPVLIYFPGCGEVHNGRMYLHSNGAPNYSFGLGRLFAGGSVPVRDVRVNVGSNNTLAVGTVNWWNESINEYTNTTFLDGTPQNILSGTTTQYSTSSAISDLPTGVPEALFQTGRQGTNFTYRIPLISAGTFNSGRTYTVRLYFAETDPAANAGTNVFNITIRTGNSLASLTDRATVTGFDIFAQASNNRNRAVVRTFTGVPAGSILTVNLTRTAGVAKLAGLEIVEENSPSSNGNFEAVPRWLRDDGGYFSAIPKKTRGVAWDGVTTEGMIVLCMQWSSTPEICGLGQQVPNSGNSGDTTQAGDLQPVLEMIRNVYTKADMSRIYLTGMSAGGTIAWTDPAWTVDRARRIAATVPVAAAGTFRNGVSPSSDQVSAEKLYNAGVNAMIIIQNNDISFSRISNNEAAIQLLQNVNPSTADDFRFIDASYGPTTGNQHSAWVDAYDVGRTWYNDGVNNYDLYQWLLLSQNLLALPVALNKFDARKVGDAVRLDWATASESNSNYFTLERSENGVNFSEITRVSAAGNSSSEKQYSFTDRNLPASRYVYYRLKQTDKDGSVQQFGVRKVFIGDKGFEIRAYPTITTGSLTVDVQGISNEQITLRITDMSGKLLMQQVVAPRQNRVNLRVGHLAKGMYLIHASSDTYQHVTKFVKQ